MNCRVLLPALVVGAFLLSVPLLADDVTGSGTLLCSGAQATRCFADGECSSGPPWKWDIPVFIEIDLDGKELRTTEASGENRSTPIKGIVREKGLIFLQGVEGGRAFSFVITEETGFLSVGVATEGMALAVFGACTPKTEGSR
jgi:hypothetical protein